jgi:hypothetical protein
MTSSEKIKVIKEISVVLSKETWSLIDLTLKQFKFPISDEYTGDTFNYVLMHIKDGKDKNLIELAAHLGIMIDSVESELKPVFWKEGYTKLFITHLASDKVNAHEIKKRLGKYSISGFVAHDDIEPTRDWQNEIEVALRTCDALLALMVKGFHESKWTDQEIGVALGRDILIIPVRMGQDPYGFIAKYQAITYTSHDDLIDSVLALLLKNKKTSKRMSYSLMNKFENSESYAEAKENIILIEKLKYWDSTLSDRLKNSVDSNSQIKHSYGVPERISNLINKFAKE